MSIDSGEYIAFLAGNTMAMPAVRRLKFHGYKIIIVDRKPCDEAYKIADIVVVADIMKPKEVIVAVRNYKLCAVMPINDFGIHTGSQLALERKLPGWNEVAAVNVTSKSAMKKCWVEADLPTPLYSKFKLKKVLKGEFDWTLFPAIVKPSFAGGASRGVFRVENKNEIIENVKNSQGFYLYDEVIIEEFIIGTEHTVEAIIFNGKSHILSISDKKNYPFSDTVVQKLYFPGAIGNINKNRIESLVQDACKALELNNGCAHFEVIINNSNIYLLEVGGRPGGGLNFFPIGHLSTGFDYPLEYARVLSGFPPLLSMQSEIYQLGWYFWETPSGHLKEIIGIETVEKHPAVIACETLLKPGTKVNSNFKNDMERPAYCLVKGKTKEEVDIIIEDLRSQVVFITE